MFLYMLGSLRTLNGSTAYDRYKLPVIGVFAG